MAVTLFTWLTSLVYEFGKFGTWLTQPLPTINMSPLALIGFTGITTIIAFLIVRLFIGG